MKKMTPMIALPTSLEIASAFASSPSIAAIVKSEASLVRLKEEAGNAANYLVAYDPAGIMELVQLNGLEFHPWGSHADNPDIADRVVFDLDPGPNVPWSEVKAAALHVRDLLKQAGYQRRALIVGSADLGETRRA